MIINLRRNSAPGAWQWSVSGHRLNLDVFYDSVDLMLERAWPEELELSLEIHMDLDKELKDTPHLVICRLGSLVNDPDLKDSDSDTVYEVAFNNFDNDRLERHHSLIHLCRDGVNILGDPSKMYLKHNET